MKGFLTGTSRNPRSERICRRAENFMRGSGIGTLLPHGPRPIGVLSPDDLSNRTAVETIAQAEVNVDGLPREKQVASRTSSEIRLNMHPERPVSSPIIHDQDDRARLVQP